MSENRALSEILTDRPIAYHPLLAQVGGGVQAGVFLSQLLYWTPRAKSKEGWVWKSVKEWQDETGMTEGEIKRARRDLKKRGLIAEDVRGVPATVHYQANLARIEELLEQGYEEQKPQRARDEKGKFAPVCHNTDNCPSLPQNGKLVYHNTGNLIATERQTSSPQQGQLSIDYTEITQETTTENMPAKNQRAHIESKPKGNAHFVALAECCSILLTVATANQKRQLGQSSKLLKKTEATPEQITLFREWWDVEDWRGKKGQAPTPAQVRAEWGRFLESGFAAHAASDPLDPLEAVPVEVF